MTIRKIKANKAQVHDDYLDVETRSYKTLGAFIGLFSGLIIGGVIGNNNENQNTIILLGGFIGLILGLLISPGRVVRQIPSVDLVEIKRYSSTNRVTVVLDDERTKRRQPVSSHNENE